MCGFDELVSIYLTNLPTCLSHYLPLVFWIYLKNQSWYCYGGRASFEIKKSSIRCLFCINRCEKRLQHFNTCKEYPDYWMIDFLYYLLLIRAYVVLNSTSSFAIWWKRCQIWTRVKIVCCLLVLHTWSYDCMYICLWYYIWICIGYITIISTGVILLFILCTRIWFVYDFWSG